MYVYKPPQHRVTSKRRTQPDKASLRTMMSRVLLVSLLASSRAGAPAKAQLDDLNDVSLFPHTCQDAKDRFLSSDCCGAEAMHQKPYLPVLSGTCKSVPVIWEVEWNAATLFNTLSEQELLQMGLNASAMPPGLAVPQGISLFDMFRSTDGGHFYKWFRTVPEERALFQALWDSVELTWPESVTNVSEAERVFASASEQCKSDTCLLDGTISAYTGPVPTYWKMTIIELLPSCKALLYNSAQSYPDPTFPFGPLTGGMDSEMSMLKSYGMFVKSMDMKAMVSLEEASSCSYLMDDGHVLDLDGVINNMNAMFAQNNLPGHAKKLLTGEHGPVVC